MPKSAPKTAQWLQIAQSDPKDANAATDTEDGEEHELIQTGNRKSGRM